MQDKIKLLLKKYNKMGTTKLYAERKYDESLEYIIRALQCAELLEDWQEIVYNRILIGHIYVNSMKDISYAMKLYTEVLDMMDDLQKQGIEVKEDHYCMARYGLARTLQMLGKLDQVIPILEEVAANDKNKRRKINALNDMGLTYWRKSNLTQNDIYLDQALDAYEEALELCNEDGFLNDRAMVLNNMGIVYYEKHKYDLAISSFEEALSLTDDDYYIACISNEMAKTYIKLGNFHMAKKFINKANQILIEYEEESIAEIELLRNLAIEGLYQRKIGNFEDAVNYFELAATKLEDIELKIEAAETFHQLSLMLKERGDIRSGRYALKFEELAKEIEEREKVFKS